jgi:tRNA uridine 5-carboxymethylaminomethyl modification enzyme
MTGAGYELVVVGAGHAGVEAAAAAARLGARVAVVTLTLETVAQMPCNPAMGGIGKGHLMAELDALGGVQPWAADRAGLQFKVLNQSRGPAVWGPRAQCDKQRYTTIMRRVLQLLAGIDLFEGEVTGLLEAGGRIAGVRLDDGRRLEAGAVILTTGTFLGGILHTGDERRPGGRFGERPSVGLGGQLAALGLELRRFKTGTPPRIHRATIEYERLQPAPGDREPRPFSWRTGSVTNRVLCWLARTPEAVQAIIGDNLHRSPLFSGRIEGVGPRYCPSIEDKVVRFPHHRQHTVFLEPEGLDSDSMYLNGLATSLPRDVQERVVRAIPGFASAAFLRYGYAVEYDAVSPQQVAPTLECLSLPGLFLAGQLLGTSGYEEAAALGFVAGVNAVLRARGEAPFVPERERSYVGVLVDDLCSADHREPYRMLTSRAEHRLVLGVDSARERMMPDGHRLGLIPDRVFHVERRRWERRRALREELASAAVNPDPATRAEVRRIAGVDLATPTTWAGILRRQDVDAERAAAALPLLAELAPEERRAIVGELRYDGYLARHRREVERLARLRHLEIPPELEPGEVPGISREAADALRRHRPRTIADAERLPGMTPAAVAILVGRLGRSRVPAPRAGGGEGEERAWPDP